jgi:hypothetical protein
VKVLISSVVVEVNPDLVDVQTAEMKQKVDGGGVGPLMVTELPTARFVKSMVLETAPPVAVSRMKVELPVPDEEKRKSVSTKIGVPAAFRVTSWTVTVAGIITGRGRTSHQHFEAGMAMAC